MLFLQWEARDWGWRTRTPAHPPRAARAGHPRGEESLTRTGLRDPAPEGFGQGQRSRPRRRWAVRNGTGAGGPRGGVPWNRRVSPWDCRASPGCCRECLGRPRLPRPRRAEPRFDGRPSPRSFSPGSVNPEGAGGGAAPPGTAWPTPVPGKSHRLGAEPPWGAVSSARRCLTGGVWGQEWDTVTLHCGTTRGWSHCIPTCSSSLAFPAPPCEEEEREEA